MGCTTSLLLALRSIMRRNRSRIISHQQEQQLVLEITAPEEGMVTSEPQAIVTMQEKPKLIDPLDYEAVISELEPEFREDPLQDLLLFPDLDFTVSTLPVERRTVKSTVPEGADTHAECLLVRQACQYYNSHLHVIQYKYEEYAGDYRTLPSAVKKGESLWRSCTNQRSCPRTPLRSTMKMWTKMRSVQCIKLNLHKGSFGLLSIEMLEIM
ncbi:Dedicator of cytokinesis protein 10 [Labeo rohita]|uniref:Dedicator of cytokinesis protein 10 n=1 Tax=Labeo rohita TaxID=84645 RepID=A0ABQ8M122_LABRO|nr:Dedicator of cytokinesis protein 10 [Labeo rohita]